MEGNFDKMYWDLKEKTEQERYSWSVEKEKTRKDSKARSFTSLIGGVVLGSFLTAYCWVPYNMSVRDVNTDGRDDVVVQQMTGVERNYLQQQDGNYKLNTKYLDDLLTITPW